MTHEDRVWHHEMETLEGIHEHAERIASLEELVLDMWEGYNDPRCEDCPLKDKPACADCPICAREASVIDRMRELGLEVE